MKILVAVPCIPWPLFTGGNVAVVSTIACLQRDHEFTLMFPVFDEDGMRGAAALQAQMPYIRIRAVNCGRIVPNKRSKREIIIRALRWGAGQCFKILLVPAPTKSSKTTEEEELPHYPFYLLPEGFVNAVLTEVSCGIDLVQLEFVEMLSLGACLPPEIPKLFVHHQLHFVYFQRFVAARKVGMYTKYLGQIIEAQEEAYLRKFDGVVVFSANDERLLRNWVSDDRLFVSPFPVMPASAVTDAARSDVRFSFVGSEMHFPNRDGVEWLLAEVWPLIITQIPDCTLQIIGEWNASTKARLSGRSVQFVGFVADLAAALRGCIMLVPLRIGSGIRVKVLDALSHGVPVISTSIGCEGIPAVDGEEIVIRDNAEEFAHSAVELATNRQLRARLGNAGRDLASRLYSPESVRRRRNEIYQTVLFRDHNDVPCTETVS